MTSQLSKLMEWFKTKKLNTVSREESMTLNDEIKILVLWLKGYLFKEAIIF